MKKELIKYFKSIGIEVYTNTKARGHQGFYLKNRIDVSKNVKEERVIPTLLHEFAHFIHDKLEPGMAKTGGSLEVLFCLEAKRQRDEDAGQSENYASMHLFLLSSQATSVNEIQKELSLVTNFVDENSVGKRLKDHREKVKNKIKGLELTIKEDYPNFMRSKKFREFERYIKKSNARYLLKYDRVKFVSRSLFRLVKQIEVLSVDALERDFPDMPPAFCAYIRLKSQQRKQARISRRINYLNKYYSKPTELFARFIEGLYIDCERTKELAPVSSQRFFELLESGYYLELRDVFYLISGRKIETTDLSVKYLFAQS